MTTTTNGKSQRSPDDLSRLETLIANVMHSRTEMLRQFFNKKRDLDDECDYPKDPVPASDYQALYDRDPIAARVVEVYPLESWQVQPTVYESEDAETITPFEEAWDGLGRQLRGEKSYYRDEEGSPVWEYLRRADVLSGIGQFGILLLGIDDKLRLSEPVQDLPEGAPLRKLLYLRCFPQSQVEVTRWDTVTTSPRYCQPLEYQVTFSSPVNQASGSAITGSTEKVHWSRVIHVADNLGSSETLGEPRMRPVLNNILNCRKVYGASAEGYWKSAFAALAISTHPQLGGDVQIDEPGLKDMVEDFHNGLQRALFLMGMSATTLAPSVVDPTSQLACQIEAICIKLDIPVPEFKGYEIGEQASTNNRSGWHGVLKGRQTQYLTPRIIIPFADRLITLHVLPVPSEGYCVWWPDITEQTAAEKASVAAQTVAALAQYVSGGVENVLPLLDLYTRFLGLTEEEGQAIIRQLTGESAEGDYAPETDGEPEGVVGPEQSEVAAGGSLAETVGGSNAILGLQQTYYEGKLPREACMENAILIFGFTPEEAERLFPELAPEPPEAEGPLVGIEDAPGV